MRDLKSGLFVLCFAVLPLFAQAPPATHKSVRGVLKGVDVRLSGIHMQTDDGKQVAWKFNRAVIAEAAKVKLGAPVIVIYRLTGPEDKRVTALAFPDPAATPTYVNLTGERILLRSAPAAADGSCGAVDPAAVHDTVMPPEGRAEVLEGCWCCAPSDASCTPGTKSGAGWAYLDRCFE